MDNLNDAVKKLDRLSKSYDGFFTNLNEANKTSMPIYYTKGIHMRRCKDFFIEYIKAQSALIRWVIYLGTPVIALLFPYLKIGTTWLNNVSNQAYYGFVILGCLLFITIVLGWINKNTLLRVTEPSDNLFHIGAYEKDRNLEYKRNYDFFKEVPLSFDILEKIVSEEDKDYQETKDYYEDKPHNKDDLHFRSTGALPRSTKPRSRSTCAPSRSGEPLSRSTRVLSRASELGSRSTDALSRSSEPRSRSTSNLNKRISARAEILPIKTYTTVVSQHRISNLCAISTSCCVPLAHHPSLNTISQIQL